MLITKKPGVGDLIAIKLTTGEEVVGRIEENQPANGLTLKSPVGWMLTQQGVMPAPVMVTADEKPVITFENHAIIARTPPRQEIADAYIQITTGIEVAKPGAVSGFMKG